MNLSRYSAHEILTFIVEAIEYNTYFKVTSFHFDVDLGNTIVATVNNVLSDSQIDDILFDLEKVKLVCSVANNYSAVMEMQIKQDLLRNNKIEFLFLSDVRVDNAREITYEKVEKEVK